MTSTASPDSSPARSAGKDIDIDAGTNLRVDVPSLPVDVEPILTTDEQAQRDDLPVQPGNS